MDTFIGSGSTLIACEQTDRIGYGAELDESYASVVLRRHVKFTGSDKGVFVEGGGDIIPYAPFKAVCQYLRDKAISGY